MVRYPYRRELSAPGIWTSMDLADPRHASGTAILVGNLRQEVLSCPLPAGVSFSVKKVLGFDGEEISCFCLEPEGVKEAVPGMLYCHGGGFFLPTQPMMVKLAAQYARELGIRVFLPEYRILPDYPNPVPFQDCLSVWNWIQSNGTELNTDVEKLLLYGESAGGTLAAGLALWQRENLGHKAVGQMLIYPALDNRFSRYSSMRQYSEAAWPLKNNLIMWKQYLKNGAGEREDYIIPMKAQDVSNLPPAYVEVQQFDILHDEAAAYAQRLQNAGVPTRLSEIEGSYHGFDADTENPFVQSVVRQRIRAMVEMLKIV